MHGSPLRTEPFRTIFLVLAFSWAFGIAWFVSGCSFTPRPVPPVESKATCTDVAENLAKLPEACGEDLSTFVQRCEDASAAERELGIAFNRDCLHAARSCDEARACK